MDEEYKKLVLTGGALLQDLKGKIHPDQYMALNGFMLNFDNFANKAVIQEKAKTEQVMKGKHHADSQLMEAMAQVITQHTHKHTRTHTHTHFSCL